MTKITMMLVLVLTLAACINHVEKHELEYTASADQYDSLLMDVTIYYNVNCDMMYNMVAVIDSYGQAELIMSTMTEVDARELNTALIDYARSTCNGDEL